MGARTAGREAALKMLFGLEGLVSSGAGSPPGGPVSGQSGSPPADGEVEGAIALFWREFGGDPEARPHADEAVRGVVERRAELDETIRVASEHWRIERMTRVDRNVLRLGTWELLHKRDIPRAVILDEAVELAKRYGSEESSAFVNGVLNQIAENLGRADTDR